MQNQTRSSAWTFTVAGTRGRFTRFLPATVNATAFKFKFRVKAASGVHLAFLQTKADRADAAYEVVLGAAGNSRSMLRFGTEGPNVMLLAEKQGVVLSATEMLPFWVSFDAYRLTVGQGTMIGENELLTADVNAMRIGTGAGGAAGELVVGVAAWDAPIRISVGQDLCPGAHTQTRVCATEPCPRACNYTDWAPWSSCSTLCVSSGWWW